MIDIQHSDGVVTRYAHISSFVPNVRYGAAVTSGQVIGLVGHTGDATGNHVHFEVRLNGYAVDPAPFIGLGRCVVQPPKVPLEEAYAPAGPSHH
jgi:murein DD-endopeptidase MepM/ murein hydrolase activator NlpD